MEDKVRIISLGGNEEGVKETKVVEINDDIFVINCGSTLPDRTKSGVTYIIPRMDYIFQNKSRLRAYFILAGNDTLMGALPFIYDKAPAPIYCSAVTKLLIENLCEHNNIRCNMDFHVVEPECEFSVAGRKIRFFPICSNFPNSSGVAISTSEGNIVYATSYVIDNNAYRGHISNSEMLGKLVEERTLALMLDSWNSESIGYANPKYDITYLADKVFMEAPGRIFVALETPDVYNCEQLIKLAIKYKRKIIPYDDDSKRDFSKLLKVFPVDIPKENIGKVEDAQRLRPQDVLIVMVGYDVRTYHKISLLANGDHPEKRIQIIPDDTFILGVHYSIDREIDRSETLNDLYKTDAHIVSFNKNDYVRIHPFQEDVKAFIAKFRPKYYIPILGRFKSLIANAKLALDMGVGLNFMNTFVLDNGMVLSIDSKGARISQEKVITGDAYIEGREVTEANAKIQNERAILGEDGAIILAATISRSSRKIVAGPDVQTRGFVFVKDSEPLLKEINRNFVNCINTTIAKDNYTVKEIEDYVSDAVFKAVRRIALKTPLIIPIIVEID